MEKHCVHSMLAPVGKLWVCLRYARLSKRSKSFTTQSIREVFRGKRSAAPVLECHTFDTGLVKNLSSVNVLVSNLLSQSAYIVKAHIKFAQSQFRISTFTSFLKDRKLMTKIVLAFKIYKISNLIRL